MRKLLCCSVLVWGTFNAMFAQTIVRGKVFDAATNEILEGATIIAVPGQGSMLSDKNGHFLFNSTADIDSLYISSTGYQVKRIAVFKSMNFNIGLQPYFGNLNEVIVSAGREKQVRTEAPVAINVLSKSTIEETKATRLDMLINKVPGIFMVDLGNEQHSMSMRQPLGYGNLYLYLEDGIPIRTVGDFNHNALIEINQASLQRIEVIKGPASSLYGSEAVGGAVNFITQTPTAFPSGKIQIEGGSRGYKRSDLYVSNTYKKMGIFLGGYYADQDQSDIQHNDFRKGAITARIDYNFNDRLRLSNTIAYINYKTDQKGGLDSLHFYNKDYLSFYRFTYRKVNALRIKSSLTRTWDEFNRTSFTLFFRNSAIGQNPFYYITDIPGNSGKATGQVNEDAFKSYGSIIQHVKDFQKIKSKWITGVSLDFSPATYYAKYIDIDRDINGVYYQYTNSDSLLTDYKVNLLNSAIYTQFEFAPYAGLKVVVTMRYDRLDYKFDNYLPPGAFTGAPATKDHFARFTPKVGLTYDLGKGSGVYSNYSIGFAPPNITDLYTGVTVPVLKPASYNNYEIGGWFQLPNSKGYAEISIYQLDGTNEIINVRLPNGTYTNQNAGKTKHRGIEVNTKLVPSESLMIRAGGTLAQHTYIDYILQGKNYSGNKMPQAPAFIVNAEIIYKPSFMKGFRAGIEYQGVGKYYTDPENSQTYNGFAVFNARIGYAVKQLEVWLNCINLTNALYATTIEKSAFGTSYRPGQLNTFNIGVGYHFGKIQ